MDGFLKEIDALLKGAPTWLRIGVALVLLGLLCALVWHQVMPAPHPRADFDAAYHETAHELNPSMGAASIAARIEDLINVAATDEQRCKVGELYLDIAKGVHDPFMPGGLESFISSGSQRSLPCVAHLEERAKLVIAVAATQPAATPGAAATPRAAGAGRPLPQPVTAVVETTHGASAAAQILKAGTNAGAEGWMYLGLRASSSPVLNATRNISVRAIPQTGDSVTTTTEMNLRKMDDPRRGQGPVIGVVPKGSTVSVVGAPVEVPSQRDPGFFLVWAPVRLSDKNAVATATAAAAPTRTPADLAHDPAYVSGVDVSAFQGNVDWSAVAAAGAQFAFVKATEGVGAKDQTFDKNWDDMKAAGLLRGAYHMLRPGDDPDAQARNYLAAAKLQPGDLPAAVDLELMGDITNASPANMRKVLRWLQLVQDATGAKPIVYAGYAQFSGASSRNPPLFANPLWIPSYGATSPVVPPGWEHWTFWQYSSHGTVDGIRGEAALDRFNGNVDQLRRLEISAKKP